MRSFRLPVTVAAALLLAGPASAQDMQELLGQAGKALDQAGRACSRA